MIKIAVVETDADGRGRLIKRLSSYLRDDVVRADAMPQVSLRPVTPEEARYLAAVDVLILGKGVVAADVASVQSFRKQFSDAVILVEVEEGQLSLAKLEHLARLGADDTIHPGLSAADFFRKIILLSKKARKDKSGTLILVDSGKGGVGGTTITAALGEALIDCGLKVLLIDLDSDTQDLCRFLQVRPYINEPLQLMLSGMRAIVEETVSQSITKVWSDEDKLYCMAPAPDSISGNDQQVATQFLSVIELLDAKFDVILVDAGSMRGALKRSLYRVADHCIMVMNNDPAGLFPTAERIAHANTSLAPEVSIKILVNNPVQHGLPSKLIKAELARSSKGIKLSWCKGMISYCSLGASWPGSGGTLYGQATEKMLRNIDALIEDIFPGLQPNRPEIEEKHQSVGLLKKFMALVNSSIKNKLNNQVVENDQVVQSAKPILMKEFKQKLITEQPESLIKKRAGVNSASKIVVNN